MDLPYRLIAMKPKIIFFARDYQTTLFPLLNPDFYESIFVTFTSNEKKLLIKNNINVAFCFEEEYYNLIPSGKDKFQNIETSFFSDRYFGKYNITERNDILSKEFAFWDKVFTTIKPSYVINEVIAIEIAEVMYIKAKEYKVEYLAWMVSPFPDKLFYWLSNPFHASLNTEIFDCIPSKESYLQAQNYIHRFLSANNFKPFYASNLQSRFSIKKNLEILFSYLKSLTLRITVKFAKKRIKVFKEYYGINNHSLTQLYLQLCSYIYKYDSIEAYKSYEIVFYPLHYEPEASIIYFSEFNEHQTALIRNISKCLKRNQILVIKEHPQQPGMLLSKEYRELKNRLSNIVFIPAEFSTRKIIEMSKIIVTQTSTAGWEAILLGKPVFVLGKVFYDKYKNINKFDGFEKLRDSILKESYLYPEYEETLRFISLFWDYCEYGNPYPHKNLYQTTNLNHIVNSIERKIALHLYLND